MIRFCDSSEHEVTVEVMDYSRESKGPLTFTFRHIDSGESLDQYFDRIMNKYWWETGKNKRRYHEL